MIQNYYRETYNYYFTHSVLYIEPFLDQYQDSKIHLNSHYKQCLPIQNTDQTNMESNHLVFYQRYFGYSLLVPDYNKLIKLLKNNRLDIQFRQWHQGSANQQNIHCNYL